MKLALRLDLYRAAEPRGPRRSGARGRGARLPLGLDRRGVRHRRPVAARLSRRVHRRIKLGTAVVQLAARPPTTLAMHAMTIDALAGGGRVIIGVGVSGPADRRGLVRPAVGPSDRAAARLPDHRAQGGRPREAPVTHDGPEISLPYRGPGAIGQGKALQVDPARRRRAIPLWLASGGPRNTELCAELCDGWLPMGLPPTGVAAYRDDFANGASQPRAGGRTPFEVFSGVQRADHRRRGRRARPACGR